MAETVVKDGKVATVETATAGTKMSVQTKDFLTKIVGTCTDSALAVVVAPMVGTIVGLMMGWNRLQKNGVAVVGGIPALASTKKPKN